jgi:hypothetical protein
MNEIPDDASQSIGESNGSLVVTGAPRGEQSRSSAV